MRLFIGVDLPAEIKQDLLEFQSELRLLGVNGSFKSQDNLHITLEFLGELDASRIPALTETLSRVASNYKPFDLNIVGLGAFPSFKRPHTLWTAVNGSLTELNRLRDELHSELKNKSFELEERQFKPHVTLASRPNFENIDISAVQSATLGEFLVKEVVLFESRAIGGKRVYTDLFKARLEPLEP
ncbi:RNA 2',3'-cyclic phosphodiesterase [Desulfosporosinus sp.]|uniref:RNA 2',3'-cyclic phosphodiesterase n=1 Tax=Desulfosporosinus sp. TaxID=157907 RepID=UPI002316DD5C|nr:RNA 2',3'-cyclic phosphodiesterase [Desulfosporosinus sp.]MCO5387146.1 RNA 2',3'-cyclic phosphodiesterase [Desulfosporosinus sp.]MDA8222023.1 RNA 2',3'-cyclic phosphodiesterase [Desulfitobacterium hafniense]